jgi:hypothetical protein
VTPAGPHQQDRRPCEASPDRGRADPRSAGLPPPARVPPGRPLFAGSAGTITGARDAQTRPGTGLCSWVIDMSDDNLSARARFVFRAMTVHPGDVWTVGVAGAAVELGEIEMTRAMAELVETDLVLQTAAGRRNETHCEPTTGEPTNGEPVVGYRFHHRVLDHAARVAEEDLTAEERERLLRRMGTYYRDQCVAADLRMRPIQATFTPAYQTARTARNTTSMDSTREAMSWIRQNRLALMAMLREAARRRWWELVMGLAEPMGTLLLGEGHDRDVVCSQDAGAHAAGQLGHPFEAVAMIRAACALRYLGQHDEARARCAAAMHLARAQALRWDAEVAQWVTSGAAHARGMAAEAAGDLQAALGDYEHSLRVEHTTEQQHTGRSTGQERAGQRRPDSSTAPSASALSHAAALRWCSVAWVRARLGDLTTAHRALDMVETTMLKLETGATDNIGYGRTRLLRGRILVLAGEWHGARAALVDAEQHLAPSGAHRWLIDLYETRARVDLACHDIPAARRGLTAAHEIALADGHHDQATAFAKQLAALPTHPVAEQRAERA